MASTASTVHAIASSSGKGFIVSRKMTMARPASPYRCDGSPGGPSAEVGSLDHAGEVDLRAGRAHERRAGRRFILSAYAGRPGTGSRESRRGAAVTGSARSLLVPRAGARKIVPTIRVSGTDRAQPRRGAGHGRAEALLAAGSDAVSRRTVGRELHASTPRCLCVDCAPVGPNLTLSSARSFPAPQRRSCRGRASQAAQRSFRRRGPALVAPSGRRTARRPPFEDPRA